MEEMGVERNTLQINGQLEGDGRVFFEFDEFAGGILFSSLLPTFKSLVYRMYCVQYSMFLVCFCFFSVFGLFYHLLLAFVMFCHVICLPFLFLNGGRYGHIQCQANFVGLPDSANAGTDTNRIVAK